MFDMNDTPPQTPNDLIPDGSFAKVTLQIRPGGVDGPSETDRDLLKAARTGDVKMLDCEFTVVEGPLAKRKFWQMLTIDGGKRDEQGVSIGGKITRSVLRAMLDSAQGLDPNDMSEAAKAKRILRGLADFNGIIFAAKIKIEPSTNPQYGDSNRLDHAVLPNEAEYGPIMRGEAVPAKPSGRRAPPSAPAQKPAWSQQSAPPAQPAWKSGQQQPAQPAAGPDWLNG